ncbi:MULTISPECIES: hypothetical protein [unclassified Mesorhizobium]|uniref:hypothetical protein n=1 Tax=unclassified Mesorhizobium TaxID=325217 RepID=UPI00167BBD75|nr:MULTISPECIES: hypothetical protein [unclassified Mesorhizobium]
MVSAVIENFEQFRSQGFPLFAVFLGYASLVTQPIKYPLEQVQISGFVHTTVARQ